MFDNCARYLAAANDSLGKNSIQSGAVEPRSGLGECRQCEPGYLNDIVMSRVFMNNL